MKVTKNKAWPKKLGTSLYCISKKTARVWSLHSMRGEKIHGWELCKGYRYDWDETPCQYTNRCPSKKMKWVGAYDNNRCLITNTKDTRYVTGKELAALIAKGKVYNYELEYLLVDKAKGPKWGGWQAPIPKCMRGYTGVKQ